MLQRKLSPVVPTGMDDWALSEDDRPTPRWLAYGIILAATIAVVSMIGMGLWLAALYLVPRSWLP